MRHALAFASLTLLLAPGALAQTWVELTPSVGSAPEARRHASAVYDATGHRMIVFAGEGASGRLNDVWAFDLSTNTWSDLTPGTGPAPGIRRTPGSAYDPVAHRMITWSGQGSGFFNDSWAFDLTTNTWSEFLPADPKPNPRYGVAAILDPVAGELVTFAGFTTAGRFDDTWRFDPVGVGWTDVTPVGTSPTQRCLHSASYDTQGHRMIMYAGQQSGPLDDIWAFDLTNNTWSDLTPVTRPDGRFFTAHVFDVLNHRATIFGGSLGTPDYSDEVWVFDLTTNTWTLLVPLGTPPTGRQGAAAIYIEDEDRMVVFGGFDTGNLNEVWSLENLSDTPTGVALLPRGAPLVLRQNTPNPFNPTTTISYELVTPGRVHLSIYDVSGRHVATLLHGERPAGPGSIVWHARDANGRTLPSGLYIARLLQGETIAARKMLLTR